MAVAFKVFKDVLNMAYFPNFIKRTTYFANPTIKEITNVIQDSGARVSLTKRIFNRHPP